MNDPSRWHLLDDVLRQLVAIAGVILVIMGYRKTNGWTKDGPKPARKRKRRTSQPRRSPRRKR